MAGGAAYDAKCAQSVVVEAGNADYYLCHLYVPGISAKRHVGDPMLAFRRLRPPRKLVGLFHAATRTVAPRGEGRILLAGSQAKTDPTIFAYWDTRDHTILTEMIAAWREHFSQFFLIGDHDVLPLIDRYFPIYTDLYEKIRLPAAKSDVARLLALYEFGGLYVDCHN